MIEGIGYINLQGEEVVKPIYEEAPDFHKGFAAVRLNGKWGAIDSQGEIVEPIPSSDRKEFVRSEINTFIIRL